MTLQVSAPQGEPVCHAFVHDISERKTAQQQLEQERQLLADDRSFLRVLLDSLDTGVAACDSTGRLTQFNRAIREVHTAEFA